MNDQFDELAKGLAQSVTRRGALKKLGAGLAGIALAALGLGNQLRAGNKSYPCNCKKADYGCFDRYGFGTDGYNCYSYCDSWCFRHSPI